jgi:hypothetical protein
LIPTSGSAFAYVYVSGKEKVFFRVTRLFLPPVSTRLIRVLFLPFGIVLLAFSQHTDYKKQSKEVP